MLLFMQPSPGGDDQTMLDVNALSLAIVTKLQAISGIQDVYSFIPGKPLTGRYPYATVVLNNWSGVFGDTIRNVRTYEFSIKVWQERTETGFGNEKSERVMREIIDDILVAFDADTTLGGVAKMVRPLRGQATYEDGGMGDTKVAEFIAECVTVVPSIT